MLTSISEKSSWVLPVQPNSSSHLLSLKPLGWFGFFPQQLQLLLQVVPMLQSPLANSYGVALHPLCLQLSHKLNKKPAHRLVSIDPAEVTTTDTHWEKDVLHKYKYRTTQLKALVLLWTNRCMSAVERPLYSYILPGDPPLQHQTHPWDPLLQDPGPAWTAAHLPAACKLA